MSLTHPAGRAAINRAARDRFRRHCKPLPKLTMSQWAARYRVVNGAPWLNDTAPYLSVIMDAVSDPMVQEVVFVAPSQSGKSEVGLNVIGYYTHQEPSPILMVQPTVEMAESFSKERIAGMIREMPVLQRLFGEARSRDTNNTILSKAAPGGGLDLAGANAPAGLAMRPKRVVILDERDRHPRSAGSEGDVKAIARARTRRWRHRRKVVEISSPTDPETSLIWPSYLEGTQEVVHLVCPHCDTAQPPRFDQLKWALDDAGQVRPESVGYLCASCQEMIPASMERLVKQRARVIETATPRVPHKRTFWLHGLLAAFHAWVEIAQEFVTAMGQKDASMKADMLRAFFNTTLGELFRDQQAESARQVLLDRAKRYDGGSGDDALRFQVPREAALITAGFDVQDDRIEGVVRAWGAGEQSWLLERVVLRGDTSQEEVWSRLDEYRTGRAWTHESGLPLRIRAAAIDSGDGEHTKRVYQYCAPRLADGVVAVKGHNLITASMIPPKPTRVKPGRLYVIGVNAILSRLYRRLGQATPGPGFYHLNEYATEDYVTQLLSMRQVVDEKQKKRRWVATPGIRNEVADCEVYAYAALLLGPIPVASLPDEVARVQREGEALAKRASDPAPVDPTPAPPPRPSSSWLGSRPRGGWMR